MTAVDYNVVRRGFRNRLKTVSDLPPISYENRTTSDAELRTVGEDYKTCWIKEELSRGPQRKRSTGFIHAMPGMTYEVHVPKGEGTEKADALAQRIAAAFEPPLTIIYQSYQMTVEHAEQGEPYVQEYNRPAQNIGIWWVVPVYIAVRLYLSTTTP